MYKKTLYISLFLILIGFSKLQSQTSFQKDSLQLEQLTDGMETFYKDPFLYRKNIPVAYTLVLEMLKEQPKNLYLRHKKINVSDLYYIFKRRQLKYEEALKILLTNLDEKKALKDTCSFSKSYRSLGNFWILQKNYDKALDFFDKSIISAKKCGALEDEARTLMSHSSYFISQKNLENALKLSEQALEISKKANFKGGIANAYWSIYRIYSLRKQPAKAIFYLKAAEEGFEETGNISALERVTSSYGAYYRKNGNPKKAISYYKRSIDFNLKMRDSSRLMYRYLGLSNSYVKLKDYEKAYYSYLNYKGIQKRVDNQKYYRKLIELEAQLEYKNQKKIDSLQFAQQKFNDENAIKQKANSRFWIFVIGLSAIVIFISFLYIIIRQRNKEQAYQNILLNKKVATKSEEIQELLNETMKHLKSKEKIASDLQKFSREEGGITLQNIIADIRASKADDTKLKLIKENIEKVNFEFIKTLKEKHSNLTRTEIEVCSFIKMGLSRKEISEVRGTSDFAVKTMRNRIRKKIQIDSAQTLDNYLASFK